MWSCSRRRLLSLAAALPAVSACGFAPIYGEGAPARRLQGAFDMQLVPNPFGFALNERLLQRLGAASAPRYRLAVTSQITVSERAIREDNTISRFSLDATADYVVTPLGGGPAATSGQVRSITAYSAIGSPLATRAAEADARRRLAVTLADQIVTRLAATAGNWDR
ncbi:hypothetical protein GE300_13725 [Rhodobacteraceae bacterium 2CG4]|uniref:LPS-assembly lipoprotein n=1 Tax=Halovulum marinum TaxID=2662447 RepID=A0A6L5Z3K3_9RHOB|nr:LPS assembly lipoprotein LptE [Halovulum marinum]MSU90660.1 hypothetical protein [Halovulum marinum]